jgi:hypothetical protein
LYFQKRVVLRKVVDAWTNAPEKPAQYTVICSVSAEDLSSVATILQEMPGFKTYEVRIWHKRNQSATSNGFLLRDTELLVRSLAHCV